MKKILFLLSYHATLLLSNPTLTYLDDLYDDGTYEPAGIFWKVFSWIFWAGLIAYFIYSKMRDRREEKARIKRAAKREKFQTLIKNLYDENHEIGEVFERSVAFVGFAGNTLLWNSIATDEDKKILASEWQTLNRHIKAIFGDDVRIVNISGKKPTD